MAKRTLNLSDSDDENNEGNELKINENYAASYNRFREKELFQALKDRYGEEAALRNLGDADESSSSGEEKEDEEGVELTPKIEEDFFKTLSCLKRKDPRIYDGKTMFFDSESVEARTSKKKTKQKEKMFLTDLERKILTERGGIFDEVQDEELREKYGYYEELEEIMKGLKAADEDDDDDGENLLVPRQKTAQEVQKEEEDYKAWLAGQREVVDEEKKKELQDLRDFWGRPDLDENEKFLRDYILNKGYVDRKNDENEFKLDAEALSEDEKDIEATEEFEKNFAFRFEEPDHDFIKRYPRTVGDTMRKKNESRKRKREEVRKRKLEEKERKMEELKQLKALKRKEIMEKFEKIKAVAGEKDEMEFTEKDLEGDFDPEKYDQRMKEIFENYDDGVADEEKPVFPELGDSDIEEELQVENWDEWQPKNRDDEVSKGESGEEEENDEDRKIRGQKEIIDAVKGRKRSRNRKSKFAELLENKKPIFDPQAQKTLADYLDEYYKLDYEDIIGGDVKCRFKYRNVEANDFGLDVREVLSAEDRELNAWASLRKTCQYRSKEEEEADKRVYRSKGSNIYLKKKVLPSLFKPEKEGHDEPKPKKKRNKKKRKNSEVKTEKESGTDVETEPSPPKKTNKKEEKADSELVSQLEKAKESETTKQKKKRNRNKNKEKKKKINPNAEIRMSDKRLEAYGLAPGQFKRKIKKRKFLENQQS